MGEMLQQGGRFPQLDLKLLDGSKRAEYPRLAPEATFRRAPRRRRSAGTQQGLV